MERGIIYVPIKPRAERKIRPLEILGVTECKADDLRLGVDFLYNGGGFYRKFAVLDGVL